MAGKNWQAGGQAMRAAGAVTSLCAIFFGRPAWAAAIDYTAFGQGGSTPVVFACQIAAGVLAASAVVMTAAYLLNSLWRTTQRRRLRNLALSAAALSNISDGVVMINARNRVVFCNDRFLEMYGLKRSDIRDGLTSRELVELRRRNGMLTLTAEEYLHLVYSSDVSDIKLADGRIITLRANRLANGGVVVTHQDCTHQRSLARQLATTTQFLESVLDNIPVCVAAKALDDGRYILANRAFEEFAGIPRERIVGARADEIFSPATADAIKDADRAAIASSDGHVRFKMTVERGRGQRLLDSIRVVASDGNGNPEFLVALFKDMTEDNELSQELETTKKFLELVVDHIPIALEVQRVSDGQPMIVNRWARRVLDRGEGEPLDPETEGYAARMRKDMQARDLAAIRKGGHHIEEHPIQTPEGLRLFLTRRVTIPDADGQPLYLVKTNEDITDRRETESRMAHMAYHDSLTNLPNRAAFSQSLSQMIEACACDCDEFAVLSVDIDRMKEINDVFGHAFGDKLIIEAARRMQAATLGGVLARLNGDEFSLIIDGEQPEAGRALAKRLQDAMATEFNIDGKTARISLTIGVAVFPHDGADTATLLTNADVALFRAKALGRGSVCLFEAQMDQQIRDRRALHQDLACAIRNGELRLHFQPLVRTGKDGTHHEVAGFEVLTRWFHPTRGLVSPDVFIPLAEESSLIVEMGEWILRAACREAASWPRPLQVAVNLSPAQFKHGDLVGLVHSILLETGLPPARLILEITEGVLITDTERGLSLLRRVKALGVGIAMDDFGSGYSSLTYLQAFPFDKIKIDQAFVMNLGRNPQSAAIVRAVIGLGHGLGITLVAEGVETQEQLDFLLAEGCDQVQGYYLGKPAPIEQYAAALGRLPPVEPTLRQAAQ